YASARMGTPRGYLVLPMVVAACAAPADDVEPSARVRQAIIGGTLSTSARDATVLVNDGSQYGDCTGTLLAPNLVLTARHCVTTFNFDDECGLPLGRAAPASTFSVSVGVYASPQQAVARATQIFVPEAASNGLCG